MADEAGHAPHQAEIKKLNRIRGQVEGIKTMITEKRGCADILAQVRAARAALRSVEAGILETHLQSCIAEALISGKAEDALAKIHELKDLVKRFEQI